MNLEVIAQRLIADQRAQYARCDLRFPEGAVFLKADAEGSETVLLTGYTLQAARELADELGASPISLVGDGVMARLVPGNGGQPAGTCMLELLQEGDARFVHFWLDGGDLHVIVELVDASGFALSVSHDRVLALADLSGQATFVNNGADAPYGREAVGYAFWPLKH